MSLARAGRSIALAALVAAATLPAAGIAQAADTVHRFDGGLEMAGPLRSVAAEPGHACTQQLVERIVQLHGQRGGHTVFLSRAFGDTPQGRAVYACWPRDRSILILPTGAAVDGLCNAGRVDADTAHAYYRGKQRIDLAHDVVPTQEAIGGSTYLVARPWVDAVMRQCREGTQLDLVRR